MNRRIDPHRKINRWDYRRFKKRIVANLKAAEKLTPGYSVVSAICSIGEWVGNFSWKHAPILTWKEVKKKRKKCRPKAFGYGKPKLTTEVSWSCVNGGLGAKKSK